MKQYEIRADYDRDFQTQKFTDKSYRKNIIYLKGDATSPQASGTKIIAHISNDIGG